MRGRIAIIIIFCLLFLTVLVVVIKVMGDSYSRFDAPVVMGAESIMSQKSHGTTDAPPQSPLRWNCDNKVADQICCFNRHYAEHSGYFLKVDDFLAEIRNAKGPVEFYDSITGKVLFTAPKGRTTEHFLDESNAHGWPSFRDKEVNWENVRVLPGGETVSVDGTHLGHNIPDSKGNRYCINLVCIAGAALRKL